jgi:hypothetical protein
MEWGLSRREREERDRQQAERDRQKRLAKERDPKLPPAKGKHGKK